MLRLSVRHPSGTLAGGPGESLERRSPAQPSTLVSNDSGQFAPEVLAFGPPLFSVRMKAHGSGHLRREVLAPYGVASFLF